LAAHQKKAARQHAALALMDESGVLMTPLVRRTWAPRGQTPVLVQKMGKRQKVSIAGALWLPPQRDHLHWFSQTLVDSYYDTQCVVVFLELLLAEVGGPLVLVWDGGPIHRGEPIQELLAANAHRLTLEPLPPYAPELNPVEAAWSWLKYGRLCNFAPSDVEQLHSEVLNELRYLGTNELLLRSFFKASELSIPRALTT
jgi:transposase